MAACGTLRQRQLQESPEPVYPQRYSELRPVAHAPKPDVLPRSTCHRSCSRGYPGFESTTSSEHLSAGPWKPPAPGSNFSPSIYIKDLRRANLTRINV